MPFCLPKRKSTRFNSRPLVGDCLDKKFGKSPNFAVTLVNKLSNSDVRSATLAYSCFSYLNVMILSCHVMLLFINWAISLKFSVVA